MARLERIFDKHRHNVTAVRFSPNDSLIISGSVDSTIKIWKRESGEIVQEIKQPDGITYLDLSADGNYIVTSCYDSRVRLWRIQDASLIKEFNGHTGTVWTVDFSPDGKKIVSSRDDASNNV